MKGVFFQAESVKGSRKIYTQQAAILDASIHSKSVLTDDNVGSAWYVRLILKICISKFFKIIKSKIQKTLIHLETVVLFRLNRIERKGRLSRLFSDPKKNIHCLNLSASIFFLHSSDKTLRNQVNQ